MSMVMSAITNASVKILKPLHGLLAVLSALLLAGHTPAEAAHGRKFVLEVSRVGFLTPIGGGQKRSETNVDSDRRLAVGGDLNVTEVAGEDDKPLSSLSLDRSSLDLPFNRAMLFGLDLSDMLDAELAVLETDAISIGREFYRVKAVLGLEPGIARIAAGLNPTEECRERFVQPTHRGLSTAKVQLGEPLVKCSLAGEPPALIVIADGHAVFLIGCLALAEADVVESAVRLKHHKELALLVAVRVQPELECFSHLLAFLPFNSQKRVDHETLNAN